MNYYISDLHLFANSQTKNGKNFDNRPFENVEEMNKYFLDAWNSKIKSDDTVYILGDLHIKGKNEDLIDIVSKFNGKKVLIKGNHDNVSDPNYSELFEEICDYKELTEKVNGETYRLVLSHYPILFWNGQHRGSILLYGHVHNSVEDEFFQQTIEVMNESEELHFNNEDKTVRAFNVGCCMPYMNYEPQTFESILNYHKAEKNVPEETKTAEDILCQHETLMSNIVTPIELKTKEQVERFCDAWAKCEANLENVRARIKGENHISTSEEAKELAERILKKLENEDKK